MSRDDYSAFERVTTRWSDNDVYGHVNNVQYYSFFDTAVNSWLIRASETAIGSSSAVGVVAETSCRFMRDLAFPVTVEIGLVTERVGSTSVTYQLGVFAEGENEERARGRFVHVYVDRDSRRPVPIPERVRSALRDLAPRADHE